MKKAPWIDARLYRFESQALEVGLKMEALLPDLFEAIKPVKPDGDDEVRQIWIRAERGTIEDYGDFEEFKEEEIVETREEFEEDWLARYPDPVKWYHIGTAKYQEQRFLYINHKLALHFKPEPDSGQSQQADDYLIELLSFLTDEICKEIDKIGIDLPGYNLLLDQNLPYEKRTGKILRSSYWAIAGDEAFRFDELLSPSIIMDLETQILQYGDYDSVKGMPDVSASYFFHLCEICYQANAYFRNEEKPLSPVEQYDRMADMRHGGLTDIDQESPEAFRKWYLSGREPGAHPWEICRGGNSTHISLYISERGNEWVISLAGSSVVRAEETVRMASALYRKGIPFYLRDGKELLRMVRGEDFIGIVPDHVTPRYCHSLFPQDERIIDYMNLPTENREAVIRLSSWYPLDEVHLAHTE